MKPLLLLAGCLSTLASFEAGAVTVVWSFEGVADNTDDATGVLGPAIVPGVPISGRFTFDSDAPDRFPADPTVGSYQNRSGFTAVLAVDLFIGDRHLVIDPTPKAGSAVSSSRIDVFDDSSVRYDQWRITTFDVAAQLDGVPLNVWSFTIDTGFSGRDVSILGSDALPTEPPPFPNYRMFLHLGETNTFTSYVLGNVVMSVPEPSPLVSCLLAAAAVATGRRAGAALR